jgi:hypothetical protein
MIGSSLMVPDYFAQVMDGERRAIVAEMVAAQHHQPFAAVVDMATVRDVPMQFRARHPVNLQALGDGSYIQVTPTIASTVLWVRTDNDDYRGSYGAYLDRCFPGYPGAIPADLHVDHLYNRERAREFSLNFIRMGLVASSPNTSHGAGYEKKRTHGVGTAGRPRAIDTVMLMKVFGFRSPPSRGTVTAQMHAFAMMLAPMIGVGADALLDDIANLVAVANFQPAG